MLMPIDAFVLFLWFVCAFILASEDGILTQLSRVPVVIFGGASLSYSIWLLSEWTPGPSGYPWQRVVLDSMILVVLAWRTVVVLIELRRNSGRLFASRPFGETVTKR